MERVDDDGVEFPPRGAHIVESVRDKTFDLRGQPKMAARKDERLRVHAWAGRGWGVVTTYPIGVRIPTEMAGIAITIVGATA